jgi:hypothetical protein
MGGGGERTLVNDVAMDNYRVHGYPKRNFKILSRAKKIKSAY